MNNGTTMLEAVARFFTGEEWDFVRAEDAPVLLLGYSGDTGSWRCVAEIREVERLLIFVSIALIDVPAERRAAVLEYINHANWGMAIGSFEMSPDVGQVVYRTSIDVEGSELNDALIYNVVYSNVSVMDRYLPGLEGVVLSNEDPRAAIERTMS